MPRAMLFCVVIALCSGGQQCDPELDDVCVPESYEQQCMEDGSCLQPDEPPPRRPTRPGPRRANRAEPENTGSASIAHTPPAVR